MSQTQQLATAKQDITKRFDAVAHMASDALQYVRQRQPVLLPSTRALIKSSEMEEIKTNSSMCVKKNVGF